MSPSFLSPDFLMKLIREPGDALAIGSILTKTFRLAKKREGGEGLTPEEETELLRLRDQLPTYAQKLGINVDILAYADELMAAMRRLEPHFCVTHPGLLVDSFIAHTPNAAPLLAKDPAFAWQMISFYMPDGNPSSQDPEERAKIEKRQWVAALLYHIVERLNPAALPMLTGASQ